MSFFIYDENLCYTSPKAADAVHKVLDRMIVVYVRLLVFFRIRCGEMLFVDICLQDFDASASFSENSGYPGADKIPSSSVIKQLAVAIE